MDVTFIMFITYFHNDLRTCYDFLESFLGQTTIKNYKKNLNIRIGNEHRFYIKILEPTLNLERKRHQCHV